MAANSWLSLKFDKCGGLAMFASVRNCAGSAGVRASNPGVASIRPAHRSSVRLFESVCTK